MKHWAVCASAALAGGISWSSPAVAAPGDATRLEYARSDRAAHCPDKSALQAAVVKRLGYDPFFPAARQTIVVEIVGDSGLRATMHWIDESGIIRGSRELSERAEHCDELVASLALAISIALDPSAALGDAPEPPSDPKHNPPSIDAADSAETRDSPEPEPTASTPLPSAKRRAPPTPKKQRINAGSAIPVALRGALFAATGAAPHLAFGWRLGPSLRLTHFKLSAEFVEQFSVSGAEQPLGGRAKVSLLEAKLAPCWTFADDSLAACALLGIGALHSEGQDVESASKQSNWNVTIGGRLESTPRLSGPLHLLLNADLNRSLTPITLRLRGETAWKSPPWSAALGAGLEVYFP